MLSRMTCTFILTIRFAHGNRWWRCCTVRDGLYGSIACGITIFGSTAAVLITYWRPTVEVLYEIFYTVVQHWSLGSTVFGSTAFGSTASYYPHLLVYDRRWRCCTRFLVVQHLVVRHRIIRIVPKWTLFVSWDHLFAERVRRSQGPYY